MLPSPCSKVSLHQRPIKNDRLSLYLDYYPAIRNPRTMKMSRREYLVFYIFANPRNKYQREYNDSILMRAEIMRCRRQESVINNEFGFLDREQPTSCCILRRKRRIIKTSGSSSIAISRDLSTVNAHSVMSP